MTSSEVKQFEDFLSTSFGEGVLGRELRLSAEELEYLKNKYPQASFQKTLTREYPDGKVWYEVKLY